MILYNVTVNIDNNIKEEWLQWMKNSHIPKVMNTKAFQQYKLLKLLREDENDGTTYCVQYFANNLQDLEVYQNNHAKELQMEHYEKFKDQFVVFRTILEILN